MPTYQYQCKSCGGDLEVVQKFSDASLTVCPECSGELRNWTSAYIGTMKKPPNMPSISRSNSTRQTAGMASRASSSCGAAPASPVGEAK